MTLTFLTGCFIAYYFLGGASVALSGANTAGTSGIDTSTTTGSTVSKGTLQN